MSGEETEETVQVSLPRGLVEWAAETTGEDGDREAAVRRLVAALREVSEDGVAAPGGGVDPAEVERRLESQRQEYVDLVEDVRERVIQVKREADAKARADHAHPEITSSVDDLAADVDEVQSELEALRETVETVEADLESGFENYEDVLTYLTDHGDELEDRLDVLARAVVDAREGIREVAAAAAEREAVEDLQLAANREGIAAADCEECDSTVRVGLLTRPECPHCGSTFSDVEPKSGLFGSHRLLTGTPPAIEGDVGHTEDRLDEMVEDGIGGSGA